MTNKLTDEQIAELAPDWATHYSYMMAGIVYQSSDSWQVYTDGVYSDIHTRKAISKDAKTIPRKKFDISEYEFSYGELTNCSLDNNELTICEGQGYGQECKTFSKKDVIAMAKALSVTAEDLK